MVSEERKKRNKEKRKAFLKACEIIGNRNTAFSKLSNIVEELADSEEEKEKVKGHVYSIKANRSTPGDGLAESLYNRWPYKEVFAVLKGHFPIRELEDDDVDPVESRLIDTIPELIQRINMLKVQKKNIQKEADDLEQVNRELTDILRKLAENPNIADDPDVKRILDFLDEE